MKRYTYKSEQFGDYGLEVAFDSIEEEIYALRNALGRYEDTGFTPEEIVEMASVLGLKKNQKTFQNSIDKSLCQ